MKALQLNLAVYRELDLKSPLWNNKMTNSFDYNYESSIISGKKLKYLNYLLDY